MTITNVAANHQFFQTVTIDFWLQNAVSLFRSLVWWYNTSTFWTWKVSVSVHLSQIQFVCLRLFHFCYLVYRLMFQFIKLSCYKMKQHSCAVILAWCAMFSLIASNSIQVLNPCIMEKEELRLVCSLLFTFFEQQVMIDCCRAPRRLICAETPTLLLPFLNSLTYIFVMPNFYAFVFLHLNHHLPIMLTQY